ncbi:ribbon-helix-helix protein, CopG family [Candidatus Woesearchaeota archaeon]|nr:ribbon-helix-helix protein, CopG family [Candidatus Woesearchaeota archaeon]
MKIKISVSMDEDTIKEVEQKVKDGIFRNKSHFIELATQRMLQGKEND